MTGWIVAASLIVGIGSFVGGWALRDQYVSENCGALGKFRSGGVVYLCMSEQVKK